MVEDICGTLELKSRFFLLNFSAPLWFSLKEKKTILYTGTQWFLNTV